MSYKGEQEDKSEAHTPPRSCQMLIDSTTELRKALIKSHDKGAIRSALEILEQHQVRAQSDMVNIHSRQGSAGWILQAYADALNGCIPLIGAAQAKLFPDYSPRA